MSIIIFEFPRYEKSSFKDLNNSEPNSKNKKIIKQIKEGNKQAKGDFNVIFDSIEEIWLNRNQQVLLFEFDGPLELTSNNREYKYDITIESLVWNYLRDKYMTQFLLENKFFLINKKVVVLCHNFHWNNIKFLIHNPSKERVWNYYFVELAKDSNCKFDSEKDLIEYLKKNNRKVLLKHWNIISDFK